MTALFNTPASSVLCGSIPDRFFASLTKFTNTRFCVRFECCKTSDLFRCDDLHFNQQRTVFHDALDKSDNCSLSQDSILVRLFRSITRRIKPSTAFFEKCQDYATSLDCCCAFHPVRAHNISPSAFFRVIPFSQYLASVYHTKV